MSHYPSESKPDSHVIYVAGIVIGILVSLIIGMAVGYWAGASYTSAQDAYFSAHAALGAPMLLYGNVSIGSMGIPRGILFDSSAYKQNESSMILDTGSGLYTYKVYLHWPEYYNVTIFYQDSLGGWQHCAATPGTVAVHGPENTQNFGC